MKALSRRMFISVILLLVITGSLNVRGQPGTTLRSFQVSGSNAQLINSAKQKLGYKVSYDAATWAENSLEPGRTLLYDLKGHAVLYINLSTYKDQFVQYQLAGGSRYSLAWNAKASIWDVYKLE